MNKSLVCGEHQFYAFLRQNQKPSDVAVTQELPLLTKNLLYEV